MKQSSNNDTQARSITGQEHGYRLLKDERESREKGTQKELYILKCGCGLLKGEPKIPLWWLSTAYQVTLCFLSLSDK